MSNDSQNNKYLILSKIFQITNPKTSEVISVILKNNKSEFKFRNKKSKKILVKFPVHSYEGNEFELILENSNLNYCSISFAGYGMEGDLYIYNTIEEDYSKILDILIKFYSNKLQVNTQDFTLYI